MALSPELCAQLNNVGNLPSPPSVATEILELAQDPELELDKIAAAISKDPVLTTKILRIANSALYARRRKSDNLAQALLVLGLNATVTLALSFSLATALSREKTHGVNFVYYWRRSLVSAIAARTLAQHLELPHREELFLAGLLQDLGMLALDKLSPEIYGDPNDIEYDHHSISQNEISKLGVDHAEIGAWLLAKWNIPKSLCQAVEVSHRPEFACENENEQRFGRCVALSGLFADVLLVQDQGTAIYKLSEVADQCFGMDRVTVTSLLSDVAEQIPDTEAVFEVSLVDATSADGILDQAREILMIRNLQSLREVTTLKETAETLENRTQELEAENRMDALTGLYNRSYLDMVLSKEFKSANTHGWPLSIAFVDMDHFKAVNDTYGHLTGDTVLRNAAGLLTDNTRDTDVAARYGGEEFILVLPGSDSAGAKVVCDRIVEAFRNTLHDAGETQIRVTVSIGISTVYDVKQFESVQELVDAADQALYRAKTTGRDRVLLYDANEPPTQKAVN